MEEIGIIAMSILGLNGLVTYQGLKDYAYLDQYSFKVDEILINKDYKRLITSGFLHVSWTHFLFNMITLYFFSGSLEEKFGVTSFLLIYFGSLIGGNLFALYVHRNHSDYSAVGASGAVSGLIFASIALFPGMEIGFIFLPVFIPGWLFGIIYVAYSIYGIKSQRDNIGHEAHLGGGVIGLIIAISLTPAILQTNLFPIALILIPSLVFLYLLIKMPHLLVVSNPFAKSKGVHSFEDKYNVKKIDKQSEIDRLLDKINKVGYDNLSKKDKDRLNELRR